MTLKLRLLFTIIPLVVFAILIMAAAALYLGVNESRQALTEAAAEQLRIENTQTKDAIELYIGTIESQMRVMSAEKKVFQAATQFIRAYNDYTTQRATLSQAQVAQLESYYTGDFARLFKKRNNTAPEKLDSLFSSLPAPAKALQFDFIAGSSFPIGEKDSLYNLNNGSDYAGLHAEYHDYFRRFLKEFGYYDIFIADIATGNIVYSVYKELDFATSLSSGPYANTGIGDAFRKAKQAASADDVVFSDLSSYLPSYNAMAGFIASPISKADGKSTAVLIYQMPLDVISRIMTHNGDWQNAGLGESGETYLVGPDKTLVTESRFFLEDQDGYVEAIARSMPQVAINAVEAGTSVGIQPVNSETAQSALAGGSGFKAIYDYRDIEVFSAYAPVTIGDEIYALLAEIDVAEALAPAEALKSKLLSSTFIAIIIITAIAAGIAVWLATRLVRPLNEVGDACSELITGEGDLTIQLKPSRVPEINRIIEPFNVFISQIRAIITQVKDDSSSLASASEELSAVTHQSEQNSIGQSQQMQQVSAAIDQLSHSIAEVSGSTVQTRDYGITANKSLTENQERADYVAENIKLLVKLIKDSSVVIGSLKDDVNQITALLNIITSIADQTNLLALNAAIEAARAGEAGRGFSVVADEVRALANRSQESTVEIARLVEKMNLSSEQSVIAMDKAEAAASGGIHLVELVTTAMQELSATINQVQDMATMVAQATHEQDVTSQSVLGSVSTISSLSDEVRIGATQISASAQELAQIANNTREMVGRFKV